MRQLILLRHAHAESAGAGEDDAGRPLSATGREEAQAAGKWLREHGIHPDRVLCSPTTRTRQTWRPPATAPWIAVETMPAARRRATAPSAFSRTENTPTCSQVPAGSAVIDVLAITGRGVAAGGAAAAGATPPATGAVAGLPYSRW